MLPRKPGIVANSVPVHALSSLAEGKQDTFSVGPSDPCFPLGSGLKRMNEGERGSGGCVLGAHIVSTKSLNDDNVPLKINLFF